jgi:hypothetical protein
MNRRIVFLLSAMTLTACGSAPTGRSTMPVSDVTPIASEPAPSAKANTARVADPTLPNKQIDVSAEGAFAANNKK